MPTCYFYDTLTSDWQSFANMSSPRLLASSSIVNGSLLVTGGFYKGELTSTDLINGDRFVSTGSALPEARFGHCSVTLDDGRIMLIGG